MVKFHFISHQDPNCETILDLEKENYENKTLWPIAKDRMNLRFYLEVSKTQDFLIIICHTCNRTLEYTGQFFLSW